MTAILQAIKKSHLRWTALHQNTAYIVPCCLSSYDFSRSFGNSQTEENVKDFEYLQEPLPTSGPPRRHITAEELDRRREAVRRASGVERDAQLDAGIAAGFRRLRDRSRKNPARKLPENDRDAEDRSGQGASDKGYLLFEEADASVTGREADSEQGFEDNDEDSDEQLGSRATSVRAMDLMVREELQQMAKERLRRAEQEERTGVPLELQRSLRVGMIGVPNAGKSVLTNCLVGGKISAVSRKINTTVVSTLGIKTEGRTQMLFYDLPGVVVRREHIRHRSLERVASAWATAAHCDLLLFVVDAFHQVRNPDPAVWQLAADIARVSELPGLSDWRAPPAVLVLNKVDKVPHEEKPLMLEVSERLVGLHPFFDVHYVSAEKSDGTDALLEVLASCAKRRPWEFPKDAKTDRSPAMVALEVTREKLFQRLNKELPYRCTVAHVSWRTLKDGSIRVEQEIQVGTEAQRGIVVGRNGEAVGAIGYAARKELEAMWGVPVHLIVNVFVAR